jgi:hypothetical protein
MSDPNLTLEDVEKHLRKTAAEEAQCESCDEHYRDWHLAAADLLAATQARLTAQKDRLSRLGAYDPLSPAERDAT